MDKTVKKKVLFLTKLSGWLCFFPIAFFWELYLWGYEPSFFLLGMMGIILVFALVLLLSDVTELCYNRNRMRRWMIFAAVFVSVLVAVPLYFAMRKLPKSNRY